MKITLSIGQLIGGSITLITIATGAYAIFYEGKSDIKELKKGQIEFKYLVENKIIPILNQHTKDLNHIHQSADSANINAKKALEIGKINVKCNIEMSKQLKGFDVLKYYDPFLWLNRNDTSLKKKIQSNLMYTNRLKN